MSYRIDEKTNELIIDGFEKGIAASPYAGIANMRGVNASYMPGVAYVNYRRQAATLSETDNNWYAGTHSVNVSNNSGWTFSAPISVTMTNPVQHATSPAGINYILDDSGNVWKQSAANSSTFNLIQGGSGRVGAGAGGIAFWNNYIVVTGAGLIEFCGDGTGDAGINYKNWNVKSSSSSITVTAAFRAMNSGGVPTSPVNFNFTVAPLTGATSATLNTAWTGPTGNYSVRFDNGGSDVRTVTFTNNSTSVSWTGGLGTDSADTGFFMYQLDATNNTFAGSIKFLAGSAVTFTSTGTLPAGLSTGSTYYLQQDVDMTGNVNTFYVTSTIASTSFSNAIILTDGGTGTITMNLVPSIAPPIRNTTITGFSWGTQGTGSQSITLASNWLGATGIYNIVDPLGNNFTATFTYNSANVSLINPALNQASSSGTFNVQILNTSASIYRLYVSKVDGNLYFANGRWIGRISSSPNFNIGFNPGVPVSYSVNYSATGTLQPQDTVVDMVDLQSKLQIAGNFDIYPWDYISAQPNASFPVGEQIVRVLNLLNNIYITAGTKGNIYVSNGSSAQLLTKIPDFISGVLDPVWKWGGIMVHRSKLWVQSLSQTTSGTNILSGIFSLIVSPGLLGEQASGLIMENQNSYGLTPASGALQNGILIDNEKWSSGVDSYYSSWSNGATTGGIDYNDSSLWQNFEPVIETDIIPIGSILDKKTLGQGQFKLDRPMASGDQIRISARDSLTSNYSVMKTTSSNLIQLSDYFPSVISQGQWIQFKIEFKCASSNSSFIPLREFRIQFS